MRDADLVRFPLALKVCFGTQPVACSRNSELPAGVLLFTAIPTGILHTGRSNCLPMGMDVASVLAEAWVINETQKPRSNDQLARLYLGDTFFLGTHKP